jgi:hypothetical protein
MSFRVQEILRGAGLPTLSGALADFLAVAFLVVLIGLAAFFILGLLVRSIAKRLIPGKTTHADPNGFFLRLYLKRPLVGFEDLAH